MKEPSNPENVSQYGSRLGEDSPPRPSEAVIEAVAAVEEIQPWDLEPPLYDTLDPDALDSLLTGVSARSRLEFDYHGYTVVVEDGGTVIIE